MSERIVFTFDICSSTSILEDLHRTGSVESYALLMQDIEGFLAKNGAHFHFEVYKFLGDGFILVFDVAVDRVLEFAVALTGELNGYLEAFIGKFVEAAEELPRVGITIGIDKGRIESLVVGGRQEYVGRPLNVAARLQASLDRPEHVNRALMSLKLYREIAEPNFRRLCSETSRSYRNLAEGRRVRCYEFDASYLFTRDKSELRSAAREKIRSAETEPDFVRFAARMKEIVAQASTSASSGIIYSPRGSD